MTKKCIKMKYNTKDPTALLSSIKMVGTAKINFSSHLNSKLMIFDLQVFLLRRDTYVAGSHAIAPELFFLLLNTHPPIKVVFVVIWAHKQLLSEFSSQQWPDSVSKISSRWSYTKKRGTRLRQWLDDPKKKWVNKKCGNVKTTLRSQGRSYCR